MRRTAHGGERIEESLEHAGLAQAIEALPYVVPVTEAFRQRAPSHIFDREEMKSFEKPAVVLGLAVRAAEGRRETLQAHAPSCRHPFLSTVPFAMNVEIGLRRSPAV